MRKTNYFVGIDISSETFTATIINTPNRTITKGVNFRNNVNGFKKFEKMLVDHEIHKNDISICMESTGVYSEKICYYLFSKNYKVFSEHPLKVKKAFDINEHKTDSVDSRQIAEYIYRFEDKAQLWMPREDVLEKIRSLLNSRAMLIRHKTAIINHLQTIKRKEIISETALSILEKSVAYIKDKIKIIEKKMLELVKKKADLKKNYYILKSSPGSGMYLSLRLLVKTNGFRMDVGYKNLASNIGICPFKKQSGSSLKKKNRSTGVGNAALRKLLHLAARSVVTHVDKFKNYYHRKIKEGKPKSLVLNNVSNKLLKIMFAMVRDGREYIPNYQSINPVIN